MTYFKQNIKTPIGNLCLVEKDNYLECVVFEKNWDNYKKRFTGIKETKTKLLKNAEIQLTEYFNKKRKKFDLPIKLEGTDFQKRVWQSLKKIPYGKTSTYKAQAEMANSPKAVRAVGRTNGLNPICIILPCHRVIGSNGKLTGYAGGVEIKEKLLEIERS